MTFEASRSRFWRGDVTPPFDMAATKDAALVFGLPNGAGGAVAGGGAAEVIFGVSHGWNGSVPGGGPTVIAAVAFSLLCRENSAVAGGGSGVVSCCKTGGDEPAMIDPLDCGVLSVKYDLLIVFGL